MSRTTLLLGLCLFGFVFAWALTAALRHFALSTRLIDHPNERSSHTVPTPRGGGLGFVIAFLLALTAWRAYGGFGAAQYAAVAGAGLLVAALGFVDDRRPLPATARFAGHSSAAVWVLWWMGPLPPVPLMGIDVPLGWAGVVLAAAYIVWSINLFNFMDGIDAIASIEAISVALGGALLWAHFGNAPDWVVALVFTACVAGFLVWNYPPARIFMGDAGSGFLGLVVATLSLWSGHDSPPLFWSWFILGGAFMVDATTTLVRRVRRGDKFHEAHRSHAYQYAARVHRSHKAVSLAIGAINLAWLLPIALLVASGKVDGVIGTLFAYAPLAWLAFRYKAGDRAGQEL